MDNTDAKNELSAMSPFLSGLEKKGNGGFQVPEGYFEKSAENIMAKIPSAPTHTAAHRIVQLSTRTNVRRRWLLGVAASFLVLVASIYVLQSYQKRTNVPMPIASAAITTEVASWYILSNLEDFQEELLEVQITPTDTSTQQQAMDAYLDYLLEDVDVETLEELL